MGVRLVGDYRLTSDYYIADSPRRSPPLRWRCARDTVQPRWDDREVLPRGQPIWAAEVGSHTSPVRAFLDAVRSFNARFVAAVGGRARRRRAHRPRPEMALDRNQVDTLTAQASGVVRLARRTPRLNRSADETHTVCCVQHVGFAWALVYGVFANCI